MSAQGFPLSRPERRSSGLEVAMATLVAVLLPPVGLAAALSRAARGGSRAAPAALVAVLSLVAAIAMLAAVGGGS
jgi:hypothetical protein